MIHVTVLRLIYILLYTITSVNLLLTHGWIVAVLQFIHAKAFHNLPPLISGMKVLLCNKNCFYAMHVILIEVIVLGGK